MNTNIANSQFSTGPVTKEGKRRSSLNALRHGLTGQTVVLPEDDLAAYHETRRKFLEALKPEGVLETAQAQAIADTHWRLARLRAMENNIFALGFQEHSGEINVEDPVIHAALAQAKSVRAQADMLSKLSLYEQRLNRALEKAHAELKRLQQERQEAQEKAMEEAAKIHNLKQALGQSWRAQDNGFDFSNGELLAWISRTKLTKQAENYHYHRELPTKAAA